MRFTQLRPRFFAVGAAGARRRGCGVPAHPAGWRFYHSDNPSRRSSFGAPRHPRCVPAAGASADVAQPSPTMGILDVVPDQGVVGTPMTISGCRLARQHEGRTHLVHGQCHVAA